MCLRFETAKKERIQAVLNAGKSSVNQKRLFLLLLFFQPLLQAKAQTIFGKIKDQSGNPIPLVTVSVLQGRQLLMATATDSLGHYQMKSSFEKDSTLTLRFSHIRYEAKEMALHVNVDIEVDMILFSRTEEMAEVTVTSQAPIIEKKIDRLVLNVDNRTITGGMNTIDLVSRAPLTIVRGESVSIIGKGECAVYLNDRPLNLSGLGLAEYLKNIPVESIIRIEIITNPPARYEAGGSGGIINIVTKRITKQGYWGSANLGFTANRGSVVRPSAFINFNTRKIRYFAGINFGYGFNPSTYYTRIGYPQQTWESRTGDREYAKVVFLSTGFETDINRSTYLALSINSILSQPDKDIKSRIEYVSNIDKSVDSTVLMPTREDKYFQNLAANLHLEKLLDSNGKKLVIDLDLLNNRFDYRFNSTKESFDENNIFIPNSSVDRFARKDQDASIYSVNMEYRFKFGKADAVLGGKLALFGNSNDIELLTRYNSIIDPIESGKNLFKTKETFQSYFGQVSGQKKKLEYQIGFRYEHGILNGFNEAKSKLFTKSYNGFFPTVNLMTRYNERNSLSMGFGRRYSRPSFSALNPFRLFSNYYYSSVGNPDLIPYYANSIKVSHNYKGKLNSILMYTIRNNAIYYLSIPDPQTGQIVTRPVNDVNTRSLALVQSIALKPSKRWLTSNEAALMYNKTFSSLAPTIGEAKGFSGLLKSVNSFQIDKNNRLSADLAIVYNIGGYYSFVMARDLIYTDLSARLLLGKDKKLQLTTGVWDIFRSKNSRMEEIVNGISTYTDVNNGTRRFFLDLRYAFGNNKIKKARGHSGLGAEQNRIN